VYPLDIDNIFLGKREGTNHFSWAKVGSSPGGRVSGATIKAPPAHTLAQFRCGIIGVHDVIGTWPRRLELNSVAASVLRHALISHLRARNRRMHLIRYVVGRLTQFISSFKISVGTIT
jgi:hypothetical protein